ncbi:MAG: histidine kinase [Saonia sp.]
MKKPYRIKEIYIHITVWFCLLLFPMGISYVQLGNFETGFLYRMLLTPILVYMNYLVLVPKLLLRRRVSAYMVISILMLVVFNISANTFLPSPPFDTMPEFSELAKIAPIKNLPYVMTAITSLSFFLLGGILGLTKDFYKRENRNKEKEARRKETELQFLRAQLNPHFLFNSLNSIYSLVRNKSNEAPEAVITLSELMRYMLYEAKQESVPLIKEIDYIKNFVALQILRLSDSENVKLKISGDYNNKTIPPLLLIPFVENAFKYGTDFKGKTDVNMYFDITDDKLLFKIKNKIGPYRKDISNSGIGLENIKTRLELLFPKSHMLHIIKKNGYYDVALELTTL